MSPAVNIADYKPPPLALAAHSITCEDCGRRFTIGQARLNDAKVECPHCTWWHSLCPDCLTWSDSDDRYCTVCSTYDEDDQLSEALKCYSLTQVMTALNIKGEEPPF